MEPTRTCQVVALADEWRRSLGLNHRSLARLLQRPESEWSHLRTGRRPPSDQFVGRLLATAPEPWRTRFGRAYAADLEARDRLHDPAKEGG